MIASAASLFFVIYLPMHSLTVIFRFVRNIPHNHAMRL